MNCMHAYSSEKDYYSYYNLVFTTITYIYRANYAVILTGLQGVLQQVFVFLVLRYIIYTLLYQCNIHEKISSF